MAETAIEWATHVWNPVTGCDRVSEGCDHCYALSLAKRLNAMGNPRYQVDGDPRTSGPGFGVTLHWDKLEEPMGWRKHRVVFVNSMSDLFHRKVPNDFIAEAFAVMAVASKHSFLVLTKRPPRMCSLLREPAFQEAVMATAERRGMTSFSWPIPNVWLGTSVENQKWADVRIPHLVKTPAAVRFLSCEPLLGPVDLSPWMGINVIEAGAIAAPLHWVISGGESGRDHRPFSIEWARGLRDQCAEADIAYFFKQVGGLTPKAGGRDLDGRTWDELPQT